MQPNQSSAAEQAIYLLAAIVDSSDDAIISKDLNSRITSWNIGAENLFGYTAEEAIGQPITMLFPPELMDEENTILARIRSGERIKHYLTERVRKNGTRFPVSITVSPVKDAHGNIVGASKIARDVSEQRRHEIEREALLASERTARSQSELASRLKDEFLATVSHELRTPLNAILGWSQLLAAAPGTDTLTEGLEVIQRNARIQAQLIEDLLDMSRIISGKVRLDVQWVDLAEIIKAALESIRPAAEARSITLRTMFDSSVGPVGGDPVRLQQVLWNLLSNAIKFTPKGGQVEVFLERVNSHLEITVTDTGIGIKPEFLPIVFDRFRQADASTTRKFGGLGLGLAIVKHLVELHGGTVRAKSAGEGMGSTFAVQLPVAPLRDLSLKEHLSKANEPSRNYEQMDLGQINILLVDDEADARALLTRLLADCNANVRSAAGVDEALALLDVYRPDVLISDIGMPGKDGYDFIRAVRARDPQQGGAVPAIALTAFARSEDRTRALLAGYQIHVTKPIEPRELLVTVFSLARRNT